MRIKNSYVVSILKKYNDDRVEEVYLSKDDYTRLRSKDDYTRLTSYPCWSTLFFATRFATPEAAKQRFFKDKEYLLRNKNDYILSSLCIKQIKLESILYL